MNPELVDTILRDAFPIRTFLDSNGLWLSLLLGLLAGALLALWLRWDLRRTSRSATAHDKATVIVLPIAVSAFSFLFLHVLPCGFIDHGGTVSDLRLVLQSPEFAITGTKRVDKPAIYTLATPQKTITQDGALGRTITIEQPPLSVAMKEGQFATLTASFEKHAPEQLVSLRTDR